MAFYHAQRTDRFRPHGRIWAPARAALEPVFDNGGGSRSVGSLPLAWTTPPWANCGTNTPHGVRWLRKFYPSGSDEPHPLLRDLRRLYAQERALFDDLRDNHLHPRLRLEQERLGAAWIRQALAGLTEPLAGGGHLGRPERVE